MSFIKGCDTMLKSIFVIKLPLKLHENGKKMDREGGGSHPRRPMDPPMHDSTLNETERDIRYAKHCHNLD